MLKTLPSSDSECAAEDWPGFSFLVLNFNLKLSVYGPEFLEEWKIMAISDSVFKKKKIKSIKVSIFSSPSECSGCGSPQQRTEEQKSPANRRRQMLQSCFLFFFF